MRSIFFSVWLLLLAGFMVACNGILATSAPSQSIPVDTQTPISAIISSSPSPSPTPFSSASPSPFSLFPSSPTLTPSPIPLILCSPLKGYTFDELPGIESQPFVPNHPGKDDGHQGVDFAHWQYKDKATLEGTEIQSVLPGIVAASTPDKYPYGNMIIVETPYSQLPESLIATFLLQPDQSLYLLYAHMRAPSPFALGAQVDCGEVIGIVGNTGASGNPHLHFETRTGVSGVTFESMEYYKTTSTPEERANYERWRFSGNFILFDPWIFLGFGS